jgi:cytochrome c-type biogenesis protein CcmH
MLRRAALIVLLFWPGAAQAAVPGERLSDPALEARARDISAELRCMVCQNQSIDESDAPLAQDLRLLVRERIEAGDSDGEVIDYVVDRYGEFVLLRPRFALHTLLLWLAAPALFLIAATVLLYGGWRQRARRPEPLSTEEEARVARLLSREGEP